MLPLRTVVVWSLTAAVLCTPASAAHAQLPTADQAAQLLQSRPDLVDALRQQIAASGMTADQIRARLQAAGYPASLLDAYIGGNGATANGPLGRLSRDSLGAVIPSESVLDAIAALGMTDASDDVTFRRMLRSRYGRGGASSLAAQEALRAELAADTTGGDTATTRTVVDSLGRVMVVPVDRHRAVLLRSLARLAASDTGMTVFGLNLFDGASTEFDANVSGPVDASYRLGAGDRLVLIITGDAEKAYTLDVTREGFIVIPGIGEVPVANLTLAQLDDVLYPRLSHVYSGLSRGAGATTHFSVNVARLHMNQVVVTGDVEEPGSYRVSSAGTALTAVYAAGGPTDNGSLRRIEIRRAGKLIDTLDVYDYLLRGDASHDPRLQSGDVVFVPVHGPRVRVYGEVNRPATYELRHGETLADLVAAAGGFTADAGRRRVQISRVLPPSQRDTTDRARVVIDVSSDQLSRGNGPPYPLEPGDVVRVFGVSAQVARRVTVQGDVWTPGTVGFTQGMHLSDALRAAGGARPDVYLGQVLVARLRPSDSTRVELRTAFRDSTGRPLDDLVLSDDDEIRVFSVSEFRAQEYVAITGAVRRPGRYAYREGMSLRDLVLLAGGPDERAYLREAEIARLPASRDGGRLASTERVPLDSTYAIGADHGQRYVASTNADILPAPTAPEVGLRPYDNVLILAQPDWGHVAHVTLGGEVHFPGTYTLESKTERLSDLLQRAGGLTQAAYAGGIIFRREHGSQGRIGVDLPRVLRDTSYRDNLMLMDGDSIFLPRYSGVVQVAGAVNAAHGVAYVPGKDIDYYIRAAGGVSLKADAGRAYVTQPNGVVESHRTRFMLPDVVPVPLPGATITVPDGPPPPLIAGTAQMGLIVQILGSLVALAAVLHR